MILKSFFLFFWRKINSKNRKIIRDFFKDLWIDIIGANMSQMSNIYGSDKFNLHGYTNVYPKYFDSIKYDAFNFLEIGVGGGPNKESGGGSLRMWKKYFPKAKIIGIDIFDKSFFDEDRIKTYIGSQSNISFLNSITQTHDFKVVVDDGSHLSNDVITSFLYLFPKMPSKGLYIIEDIHACFFDTDVKYNGISTFDFFKSLVDKVPNNLSFTHIRNENISIDSIDFIHFYPKLIIIQKK